MSDTIDRQAAIEIVYRYNKSHMILKGKPMLGATSIVIELEALPSAQPERQINLDGFETPIEILAALRSQFNCFDEQEEKAYHALSEAIHALSAQSERTSPCADCQEFDCYGCDERENRYE